jgi:hypothetical protein
MLPGGDSPAGLLQRAAFSRIEDYLRRRSPIPEKHRVLRSGSSCGCAFACVWTAPEHRVAAHLIETKDNQSQRTRAFAPVMPLLDPPTGKSVLEPPSATQRQRPTTLSVAAEWLLESQRALSSSYTQQCCIPGPVGCQCPHYRTSVAR